MFSFRSMIKLGLAGCWLEHNVAKVGVEGSNPFARSNYFNDLRSFGHDRAEVELEHS